ncbi:MAG: hypothetical protein WA880_16435, partial [Ornithinimicrobium sp.]
KPITVDEASTGIEQVEHSTRLPAYRIRGVCTQVLGPMELRISVAGLDVVARAGTFRNVGTSDDDPSREPHSDDFFGATPGQRVEPRVTSRSRGVTSGTISSRRCRSRPGRSRTCGSTGERPGLASRRLPG